MRSARKDCPNATFVDEVDLKLKGSGTHDVPFLDGPLVEVDELADKWGASRNSSILPTRY